MKYVTQGIVLLIAITVLTATAQGAEKWQQLFNGKNLNGWTPKIRGYDFGENFGNTFRVKDGVIQVGNEAYGPFQER